ncbi:sybindin-like family domain-containing protein [Ditylenchus destructor]|uniref:Trafficking protein particle complex subunit n=1 Tax=Ditylenchus destructor TaxID=166010 RepID=A0AAD4R8F7_9BILA|nr:sybindin-like family domain-containing protein [Ditylenchus destructor]
MTIYNFYFFNKNGICIAYKEWSREKRAAMSQEEEFKLVYGMLLSLRSFCSKLSIKGGQQLVQNFRTSSYRMNYMETNTGLKFVLNTDPDADGIPDLLQSIFQIYIETVLKNPFADTSKKIQSEIFHSRVDEAVRAHHCYT